MTNIRLTIEFIGSQYCGWQVQKNGLSLQTVITNAIQKMAHHPVNLIGSSRTDARVHAMGMVANFHTGCNIPPHGFLRGVNSLLPHDIRIVKVEKAHPRFHAQRSAKGKWYRYVIYRAPQASAMWSDRSWHCYRPLNLSAMRKASKFLVGRHNFSSFCAADDQNISKVRTIWDLRCQHLTAAQVQKMAGPMPRGGELWQLDVWGNGFLKQMVRNIVGTLVEVGEGRRAVASVSAALAGKDRRLAGVCAPAEGLYLMAVDYHRGASVAPSTRQSRVEPPPHARRAR